MTYDPQKKHPRQRVSETEPAAVDVLLSAESMEPVETEIMVEEETVLIDTTGSPHRGYAMAAGGVAAAVGLLFFRRKRRNRRRRRAESHSDS